MTTPGPVASRQSLAEGWLPTSAAANIRLALDNLRTHTMRSALTMLGMIFGVAAVVSMLSIGAGAQQQAIRFIETLGVRNVIVEARESVDQQAWQRVRRLSPGLTFADRRTIEATVDGVTASTARKRFVPSKLVPRPAADMPVVYGVEPAYRGIAGLAIVEGRFLDADDERGAAPVCVLGEGVRNTLFPGEPAVGASVKVNEQWLRVVGVAGALVRSDGDIPGVTVEDPNNLIYTTLSGALLRLEDSQSRYRDEIDAIYLQLGAPESSPAVARIVRGLLNDSHREAGDFSILVPAELLAQHQRTRRIFEVVMVAIASISLLVGGIGIMNIMLASILERTREIGIRRAVGARQREIVGQFLVEAILISCVGGLIGIVVGVGLSRLVGYFAGWTTIVSGGSIALAFGVSVAVGLVFGVYPATKAAALDPVTALHYE